MSVRFILGRPGTGKTESCMEEVRAQLKEDPSGPTLIYLVPDHMTFDMEYTFAKTLPAGGMTRLNVYSMRRLALRVLQQAGGMTRYHLDRTGVTMLLRKIVEQNKAEFRLFRKASEQAGFYDLLGKTITEFKRYCLTPGDVASQADSLDPETAEDLLLRDKLHDLAMIYAPFEKALAGKYVESEDYLRLMEEKIAETDFLKNAQIWIDGFQTMTPEEQSAVETLMQTAKQVTVAIGIDKPYDRPPDMYSVYRHPALLFIQLKEHAEDLGLEIEPFTIKTDILRPESPALKHLALTFDRPAYKPAKETDGLMLTEAGARREEVEQAARDILDLARDCGYRFRDITVLVRHLENYKDLVETVFSDYGIPVFIDEKRPMRHHPLIELLRSALEVVQQNWRYESVFRCVKTGLLTPAGSRPEDVREAMDELENYVLAFGIHGKKWTDGDMWTYRKYRGLEENEQGLSEEERRAEKRINRYRRIVAAPLASFERSVKTAANVRDKCASIYQFLVDLSVPEKLEHLAEEAVQRNRLTEAREHGQVWQSVIDMLDQCVEGAGSESISLDLFIKIIDAGLDSLEFATVPPAMDQVLVGSLERMRSSELKAVFLLGVNEGLIPANPREEGLFSDEDRSLLESRGVHVADNGEGQMAEENELVFRALTLPKNRLYLSYPLASEDGETLTPSLLINRLRRFFPRLSVRLSPSEPRGLADSDQIGFVSGPRRTMSYLTAQIREWQKGYPIADLWWDAYNWLIARPGWRGRMSKLLGSLLSRNEARLSPESARRLYGETIQASVSRMEQFNACPFAQFASYGLNLREREVFQLAAPDIGQLFHLAIKRMTERVTRGHRSWGDLSPSECNRLAAETVSELAPKLQRQILTSSNRHQYLQHKLEQVVASVARVMRLHAQSSGFSPVGLELPFGPGQPIPPLTFTLPNGCKMDIVGRIDRVDKAVDEHNRLLLRIIDYKSGRKDLKLADVYYGLALQMLIYLEVILTNARDWLGSSPEPAGVLYFHVHNPLLSLPDKLPQKALEDERYKRFKMKGLLPADQEILLLTDKKAIGGYSSVAPFGLKKNGEFYKNSSLAGADDFRMLGSYTKQVMKRAGIRMMEGDVRISPYKMQERIPCTYCPYRSVCRFDQSQPGNEYRLLKKMTDADILKDLLEREEGSRDAD
ncbi:helicase-exonuclease AddAB subunit AddB [Sporolactobacillus sp. THM7-7]|nr:helicase-exonuclease AddAB subunit AddB [Sporolactobacillus sp. THM7-7]